MEYIDHNYGKFNFKLLLRVPLDLLLFQVTLTYSCDIELVPLQLLLDVAGWNKNVIATNTAVAR